MLKLDALCTLGNGTMCNIEIQKENVNYDVRRVRYNASSIVSRLSEKGQKFQELSERLSYFKNDGKGVDSQTLHQIFFCSELNIRLS